MLIDTSILIDHLRGKQSATTFLQNLRTNPGLITSAVVAAELLTGARDNREQREIDRLLAVFEIEPIIPADCHAALGLLRSLRLSHGIGWSDCLIAVSAMRLQIAVATLNIKHFKAVPGLDVRRPY